MAKYFCVGATPRGCPIPCGCPLTGQARGPAPTTLYWVSVYPNWVNKYIHAYIVFFTIFDRKSGRLLNFNNILICIQKYSGRSVYGT